MCDQDIDEECITQSFDQLISVLNMGQAQKSTMTVPLCVKYRPSR